MIREPEGTKVFETDWLAASPTDDDEVNMDVQKYSGAKDTFGTLPSANSPIPIASSKPLSSNIDSRSVLPTKITSFAYSNDLPPISLTPQHDLEVGSSPRI